MSGRVLASSLQQLRAHVAAKCFATRKGCSSALPAMPCLAHKLPMAQCSAPSSILIDCMHLETQIRWANSVLDGTHGSLLPESPNLSL